MAIPMSISAGPEAGKDDALYPQAVEHVKSEGRVSISNLQRKFKLGFFRASAMVRAMKEDETVNHLPCIYWG